MSHTWGRHSEEFNGGKLSHTRETSTEGATIISVDLDIEHGFLSQCWSLNSSTHVLYKAKYHFLHVCNTLMHPGHKSFYDLFIFFVWFLFVSELEWLDSGKEFKGKQTIYIYLQRKKNKKWPIYRNHKGMLSRSNFSPTTCACVCDVNVSGAFGARLLCCTFLSYTSYFPMCQVFKKSCMTKWSTSIQSSNIPVQCAALYSHKLIQRYHSKQIRIIFIVFFKMIYIFLILCIWIITGCTSGWYSKQVGVFRKNSLNSEALFLDL